MHDAPRILLLGNSHSEAVRAAVGQNDSVDIHWLKVKDNARFGDLGMEAAETRVQALAPGDCLVLMQLGALHNIFGLLNHEQPFALIDALDCAGAPAQLIPRQAMRAHLAHNITKNRVLSRFARQTSCQVLHCMTPPPKEVLPPPAKSSKAYRGQLIAEAGFSPPPRRLSLWQLEQEVIAEYCTSIGVTLLPPPDGTQTTEGYLHPDFYAADTTHANAAYGAKVLEQIQNHLQGAASASPGDIPHV